MNDSRREIRKKASTYEDRLYIFRALVDSSA